MEPTPENMQSSTIAEMLNSTLPLDKKLFWIQLLCTGERYTKICDHDVIIKWVAGILPTLSSQDALKVYNCLNVCLKGNRVPPANGKVFFKTLLSCFMLPSIPEDKQVSSAVRGCLINILHNPFFQEILKYDISDLSTCIEVYLVTFSFSGVDGRVSEIFSVIRSMYKATLLKCNFVEEFVENILPNMFTFIGSDGACTQQIDLCFQQVLFPDTESASKYLQAFKNYKPNATASSQYEFLVSLIVHSPFICGSPMISGKFYELFCRRFIAYCKSHLIMTYDFFTYICSILGCRPNLSIPLAIEANDYNKELSLNCLNAVLVAIQESSQITHTLNMGRSLFVDYIQALVEFIASQMSETCAEFYEFICYVMQLIPSFSENVFRNALSVVILKQKDADELESYSNMLAEALKIYSKFYNMGKFVTHLFEETVKALAVTEDVSDIKLEYLLPCAFLRNFIHAALVMGTDHLCRTLDIMSNLVMECVAKIQKEEHLTDTENCTLVLQFEVAGQLWCRLFKICEIQSVAYLSRSSVGANKIIESMEIAKKLLTATGKLVLTVSHNTKLMITFFEMSELWGHMNYISNRVSSVSIDLKDLSHLYDFLDATEWTVIGNIVAETGSEICRSKLSDLLLTNLHCFPTTSDSAKKDLIKNIIHIGSTQWMWDRSKHLLENATQKQLAKICERLATEDSVVIPIRNKLQLAEKLCELRATNFFLPVYMMKTAGKLLSAGGRNLTLSVSDLLTTKFLLTEIKRKNFTSNSSSTEDIAKTMITMIADRIQESPDGQYEKETVVYLEDTLEILRCMSVYSLDRHLRLSMFAMLLALCKDLDKNKPLQYQVFNMMLDVLVGSCVCKKNERGPCINCGTYLHLPGDVDYSSLLKWLLLDSKEYENHYSLIDRFCGTVSRDADLAERTIESLQSNLELICSFHKALCKSTVLTPDGIIRRKKRRITRFSNQENIAKCLKYMADGVLKFFADGNTPQRSTVMAYACALQRALQTRDEKLDILLQHLNPYWGLLEICAKESPRFVTEDEMVFVMTVVKNRDVLKHVLPDEFIRHVWKRLQSSKTSLYRTHLITLCLCDSELCEYKWIIETLCSQLKVCGMNDIADMAALWGLIVDAHVSAKKLIILGDGLITACCEFTRLSKLTTNANRLEMSPNKSSIINFMFIVAKTNRIRITPGMFDEMFEVLNDIKPNEPDSIHMGLKLLTTLLHSRTALVVDRIPPFLQRFRFLMTTVAATCHVSERTPSDVWLPYVISAYHIERLSQKIVQHVNNFARVAPNLICHVISCLEKYTLPSVIKMHYINSVYLFLTICDKHGIEYIKRLMPEPSSEMFKTLYNNYIKYYKFTGNV